MARRSIRKRRHLPPPPAVVLHGDSICDELPWTRFPSAADVERDLARARAARVDARE